MTTKNAIRAHVKDAELGIVEAVFASHLVSESELQSAKATCIDKDGDVTLKGAFTDGQEVVVSAYGHGSWEGQLPVGKGVIREEGEEAIAELKFFLDTPHGLSTFNTVKGLGDLQEWSYSLHDVESFRTSVAGKSVRVLKKVKLVKEVSPTLMGAGVKTRTLAVKDVDRKQLHSSLRRLLDLAGRARFEGGYGWCWVHDYDADEGFVVYTVEDYDPDERTWSCRLVQLDFTRTDTDVTLGDLETEVHETAVFLPKQAGLTFSEHIKAVVAAVDGLDARAQGVVALRAEKGKSLSATAAAQLDHLAERAAAVKALADEPTHDTPTDDVAHELLRFVSLSQGANQ